MYSEGFFDGYSKGYAQAKSEFEVKPSQSPQPPPPPPTPASDRRHQRDTLRLRRAELLKADLVNLQEIYEREIRVHELQIDVARHRLDGVSLRKQMAHITQELTKLQP